MTAPLYTTIISNFFANVLQPLLSSYVYNGYQTLAEHLRLPLGMAVVLALTLLGIGISQGWIKLSLDNFVKFATKIGLIYLFAMNWGIFSQYIVNGIQGGASDIGDWLVNATPLQLPQFAGQGIQGALQSVLIELTDVVTWVWQTGGFTHPSPWLAAVLIGGFGYAMLLLGLFEIVLAQLMLAILFTLAPLFISFTLFKPTQSFFDRWFGMIAGYAFLLIFISATLALALNFAQSVLGNLYETQAVGVSFVDFVPMMVVCFLGVGIIFKVADLAHGIGNGFSIGSGTILLAGTVGGFIRGSKKIWNKIGRAKNY